MQGLDVDGRVKGQGGLSGHLHFRSSHVFLLEEELPVQVAHVDGVQVNLTQRKQQLVSTRCALFRTHGHDILKSCQDQILQELAAYPSSTNNQDLRPPHLISQLFF